MLVPSAPAFAYRQGNLSATNPPTSTTTVGTAVVSGIGQNGTPVAWGGGALSFEGCLLDLRWYQGGGSGDTSSLLDVLIDPAGGTSWSAEPLVTGVLAGGAEFQSYHHRRLVLPLRIPQGANLGLRARSLNAQRTHRVVMSVLGGYRGPGEFRVGQRAVSLGVDEAAFNGAAVANPGTTNTWGAWANIGSPLASVTWALQIVCGGIIGGTGFSAGFYAQMGVGGEPLGGSNVPHDYRFMDSGAVGYSLLPRQHFGALPAGTQLQARVATSNSFGVNFGIAIYGVAG